MSTNGRLSPAGDLQARVIRAHPAEWCGLWQKVKDLPHLARAWRVPLAKLLRLPTHYGTLRLRIFKADGRVIDHGLVGARVVTTAFVNYVVDQLQTETATFGDFKYHDSGVGTTAEAVGDTDIETTDGEARATGSQTEGSSVNIYKSVGTISYTTTKVITEHGLFNALTGPTLMDRHVFSARNVENGDSIEFTYQLTVSAGG